MWVITNSDHLEQLRHKPYTEWLSNKFVNPCNVQQMYKALL